MPWKHVDFYVKCPLLLSDYNQNQMCRQNEVKIQKTNTSANKRRSI